MKNFLSSNDLTEQNLSEMKVMDSSDVSEFNLYMKKAVRENFKNNKEANISASKVFLTR